MVESAVHEALLQSRAYPESPPGVEFRETHVSRLYFTDRHVYKVKKPVDFGFLNFTTLDRRRFYCQEEVRLNRRFAPDTYLGVVEIRRTAQGIRIGGEGEILDYAVWMKRLPEDRMLDALLARQAPELADEIRRLAPLLARMEEQAEVCRDNGGMSNLEAVRRNWRENFDQLAPFAGQTLSQAAIDLLRSYVESFLKTRGTLLEQREQEGFVRDGHGDLHAEHICLTDPIRIYDCIEFNRRFRVADVVADLAFLLMDLEFRGFRHLSRQLLEHYRAAAEPDPQMAELLPFYRVYRAVVRGKVDSFLAADGDAADDTRQKASRRARGYFNLGLGYLTPPFLVLTCGLMGSGKSTLAHDLAWATGAEVLRSDRVRKELAGLDPAETGTEAYGRGIYTSRWNRRTYDALLDRSKELLERGRSVIVDAAFGRSADRERFAALARQFGLALVLVVVECAEEVLAHRLTDRQRVGEGPSDGRLELLPRQREAFEWPRAEEKSIRVDGAAEPSETTQAVLCELALHTGVTP